MLFVILGHICNELNADGYALGSVLPLLMRLINPVKLPLFFAISGYLFSQKNDDPSCFFFRLLRLRLVPYFFWGSFMGLVAFGMDFLRSHGNTLLFCSLLAENYLIPFLLGNLVWYIPCLIVTELLFWLLLRLSQKNIPFLLVLTTVCTAAGYLLSANHIVKPWKFDTALTCTQFMVLGYLLRRFTEVLHKKFSLQFRAITCTAAYLLLLFCCSLRWPELRVDMNMGTYFQPAAFSLLAFAGICTAFSVCQLLPAWKPLIFIGRNSLLYFVWHMYAVKLMLAILRRLPGISALPTLLLAFLLILTSCYIVAVVCWFVNRFFWFTIGRSRS